MLVPGEFGFLRSSGWLGMLKYGDVFRVVAAMLSFDA